MNHLDQKIIYQSQMDKLNHPLFSNNMTFMIVFVYITYDRYMMCYIFYFSIPVKNKKNNDVPQCIMN